MLIERVAVIDTGDVGESERPKIRKLGEGGFLQGRDF